MHIKGFNEVLVIHSRLKKKKKSVACFSLHMQIFLIKENCIWSQSVQHMWKLDLKVIWCPDYIQLLFQHGQIVWDFV